MGSEWEQVSTYNQLMTKAVSTLDDVILAIIESGRSLHGEKTVAAAMLGGKSAGVTVFDTGNQDPDYAGNQRQMLETFRRRLKERGIPYVAVDIGEGGRIGIVYQAEDMDQVSEVTDDLNLEQEEIAGRSGTREADREEPEEDEDREAGRSRSDRASRRGSEGDRDGASHGGSERNRDSTSRGGSKGDRDSTSRSGSKGDRDSSSNGGSERDRDSTSRSGPERTARSSRTERGRSRG